MLKYNTIRELTEAAESAGKKMSEVILADQAADMGKTEKELMDKMASDLAVMREAAEDGSKKDVKSASGLTGGDAYKMKQANDDGKCVCGGIFSDAIAKALAISEFNASMGRIVASPTAGSCGILPGVILAYQDANGTSDEDCVMSMFTAAGIGMTISNNATLAGAGGGCQAECGSASAMAAAALVELAGGTPAMSENAAAIAIKNVLGLVCDPVAGLVEIPCIKRNAGGAATALCAADMALAGIESKIPADEVIIAMKHVGDIMSPTLKETAEGGLAATPTGKAMFEEVFGTKK